MIMDMSGMSPKEAAMFSLIASGFIRSEEMQKDFLEFSKAVDEKIAQGMTEDEALEEVGSNWDYSKTTEIVDKMISGMEA